METGGKTARTQMSEFEINVFFCLINQSIMRKCNFFFLNYLRNELTAPQLVIMELDRSEILARQLKDAVNFQSADVPSNHCSI